MRVLVTGATGFVGRALVPRLLAEGHQVVVRTRSVAKAASALGADVTLVDATTPWSEALADVDGIINLAGEPIVSGRWTDSKKRALVESRVDRTERMVEALEDVPSDRKRPTVLVSASAVGYYGDRKDERLSEDSAQGDGFLAQLCADWEAAARGAEKHGVRVATIRIGIVLGREGGALAKMLPPFKAGVGGRLASGRQYMPWIHVADLVELFVTALTDERYAGAFNGTAPAPVDNTTFTAALARALHRPALVPVPAVALKIGFGEAACVLLEGQRAEPVRAIAQGFEFRFASIESALADILVDHKGVTFGPADKPPPSAYLDARRPHRVLTQETWIDAPIDEVYEFFSKPENLGAMTPMTMAFDIQTEGEIEMKPGTEIDYRIQLGPFGMRWRTRIEEVGPQRFVDTQVRGPYAAWHHQHVFEAHGERTRMVDRVHYAAPLGPLGRIAERLFVEPQLSRIFGYRAQIIALRFGHADARQRRAA